jgi:hypothetical protein
MICSKAANLTDLQFGRHIYGVYPGKNSCRKLLTSDGCLYFAG